MSTSCQSSSSTSFSASVPRFDGLFTQQHIPRQQGNIVTSSTLAVSQQSSVRQISVGDHSSQYQGYQGQGQNQSSQYQGFQGQGQNYHHTQCRAAVSQQQNLPSQPHQHNFFQQQQVNNTQQFHQNVPQYGV